MNVVSDGVLTEQFNAALAMLGFVLTLLGTVMLMSRAMRSAADGAGDPCAVATVLTPVTVLTARTAADRVRPMPGYPASMPSRAPPTFLRPAQPEHCAGDPSPR